MNLNILGHQYRHELESKWMATHAFWDEPVPSVISTYMCRYSCLYIQAKMHSDHDIKPQIVIGRPFQNKNGTPEGIYGFCDNNGCWHDHAWLVVNGYILDITADQFHAPSVIITSLDDARYNANTDQHIFLAELEALKNRVEMWLKT